MTTTFEHLTAKVENLIHGAFTAKGAADLLALQHRDIEELCLKVKEPGSGQSRVKLLTQLLHLVESHSKVEEEVFYPAAKSVNKALTLKALEEHAMVKAIIAKLRDISTADETFAAKMAVFSELLEQHFKAEESQYFPAVQHALGDDRMIELGVQLEQAFDRFSSAPIAVKLPAKRVAASKRTAAGGSAKVSPGSKPLAKPRAGAEGKARNLGPGSAGRRRVP